MRAIGGTVITGSVIAGSLLIGFGWIGGTLKPIESLVHQHLLRRMRGQAVRAL
jgi:hypothetical protein